jgi:hypothetical protein
MSRRHRYRIKALQKMMGYSRDSFYRFKGTLRARR